MRPCLAVSIVNDDKKKNMLSNFVGLKFGRLLTEGEVSQQCMNQVQHARG